MTDLVTWLRAQVDREGRDALLIPGGGYLPSRWIAHRVRGGDWAEIRQYDGIDADDRDEVATAGLMVWGRNEDEHVTRWDPERIVAEVQAKRRILDEVVAGLAVEEPWARRFAEHLTRLLALPFADRPGYLEKWRP